MRSENLIPAMIPIDKHKTLNGETLIHMPIYTIHVGSFQGQK